MSTHFRTDIEGLRAIAVLLVIAAHFAILGLADGFIGVDIFFVISGYLITSTLFRELDSTNTIALLRFCANRLRRLLPALLVMLIGSLLGQPPNARKPVSRARHCFSYGRSLAQQYLFHFFRRRLFRREKYQQCRAAYLVTGNRRTVLPALTTVHSVHSTRL